VNLELSQEELRVLNVVLQNLIKDQQTAKQVVGHSGDDITTLHSLAGKVRGVKELSK
jgi:hypothetical protein